MKKKMSKSKVVVYVVIGVLALVALVAAAVYLPGLLQTLHGVGGIKPGAMYWQPSIV